MNLWLSIVFMIIGKIIVNIGSKVNEEKKFSRYDDYKLIKKYNIIITVVLFIGLGMYIVGGVSVLLIFKPILEVIN